MPRFALRSTVLATALATAAAVLAAPAAAPAGAAPRASTAPASVPAPHVVRRLPLGDGSRITVSSDGVAQHVSASGRVLASHQLPAAAATPLGDSAGLSDTALRTLFSPRTSTADSGKVIAVLGSAGASVTKALRAAHATHARPLTTGSAAKVVVLDVPKGTSVAAAAALREAGATFAEPDRYVTSMSTGAVPLTGGGSRAATAPAAADGLPSNYGLASSLQAFLNAGGVDAMGAYRELTQRYGQLPGAGETITNVSIGDLTDASMNDGYVQTYGPTTIVQNGQRYLDLPSMPLIPTYTSDADGVLDPTGSTEGQDPALDEVLLDFGVMAPLPHDQQRAGAIGSGVTDLLGIAPGAKYRLVVPQDPTIDQITTALMAAARQTPRPDVITASLGFGTDTAGFPGRYLEDDPVIESVVHTIVSTYHEVVVISSNDGTRLYTPTSIGPDGGSTPTNLAAAPTATTSIGDDALSTTPSLVTDSGAIAAGGTTLDDTLSVSPQSAAPGARNGTFATTRTDGGGLFSSGFGSRVDVSAPSDNIVVFEHTIGGSAHDVTPVDNGGTSASAPEIAAAAAVLLQAGRLAGKALTPAQVRATLESTGRAVPTPPQIDRPLHVGNQVDVTAAVDSVLPKRAPALVRISVAHRVTQAEIGAEFTEDTDQGYIDLSGRDPASGPADPGDRTSGLGLLGPVTIAADVTGVDRARTTYRLTIGGHHYTSKTPAIRLLPKEMLADAGLPVKSTTDRQLSYTFDVLVDGSVALTRTRTLTFGPTDGTFVEAPAPIVPATVPDGQDVTVSYDLRGVQADELDNPALIVSHIGHWNPVLTPLFSAAYRVPLTASHGTVTIPASAFSGGGGLYGIGYAQLSSDGSLFGRDIYGEFASLRIVGSSAAQRPAAPTLGTGGAPRAHQQTVTDAAPTFSVGYDVRSVSGATGAVVELSAPAPTLFNALNTFTNQNGTQRDADGVDTGSVLYRAVTGTTGSVELSAKTLKLTGSDSYNVRVLATGRDGAVVGQASPSSLLTYDDGIAPDAYYLESFAAAPTATSVVDSRDEDGGSTVRTYSTRTGKYGRVLETDGDPDDAFDVIGVDSGFDRAVVVHVSADGATADTFAPATGALIASTPLPGTYVAGRVDATRHRAAVLVRDADGNDLVVAVALSDGSAGDAIPVDVGGIPASAFRLITLDESTGRVLLSGAAGGAICFLGTGYFGSVDLDTRAVTTGGGSHCVEALADDDHGSAYLLGYRSASVNIPGTGSLLPVDETDGSIGDAIAVRQQYPVTVAIDGVHHLALVAFTSPTGVPHFGGNFATDNNATSQLAVVNLVTGKVGRTLNGFNFRTGLLAAGASSLAEPSIQLDPASRTGWTFSPDGVQVQSFHY